MDYEKEARRGGSLSELRKGSRDSRDQSGDTGWENLYGCQLRTLRVATSQWRTNNINLSTLIGLIGRP